MSNNNFKNFSIWCIILNLVLGQVRVTEINKNTIEIKINIFFSFAGNQILIQSIESSWTCKLVERISRMWWIKTESHKY